MATQMAETNPPAVYNPSYVKNPKITITAEQAACIPWPPGGPGRPCQCRKFLCGQNVDICPTKKKYCPPPRPKQVRPIGQLCIPANEPFAKETIYKGSYIPAVGITAPRRIPTGELCLSGSPLDGRTIHKLSYPGWCNVKPADPILPCQRPWWTGKLQSVTTNKHDYVPKPINKRIQIPNTGNLTTGSGPFEKCSTSRAAYKVLPFVKTTKVYHPNNFCTSKCKMDTNTTQKLSYQPNPVGEREYIPWADRGKYKPPEQKVENNTIYRMSYEPPGEVCDDECAHEMCKTGGCYCEYPGQCFGIPDPRKCLYPRAGC